MKYLPLVAALMFVSGCASAPPASAPATAAVAAPPAVSAAAAAPAAPAAPTTDGHFAPAGTAVPITDPATVSWARTQGYRPTLRDGKPLWCRTQTAIGSKIPHTECLSEQSLAEMRKAYDQTKQDMLNSGGHCADASCAAK